MSYYLFLDDVRMPKQATVNLIPLATVSGIGNTQWHIVRNFEAFCAIVEGKGVPAVVSFDHDLSEEHLKEVISNKYDFDYVRFRDTGYDAAKWLCYYCQQQGVPFPKWYVHSFNPVGTENIKKFIQGFPHVV